MLGNVLNKSPRFVRDMDQMEWAILQGPTHVIIWYYLLPHRIH